MRKGILYGEGENQQEKACKEKQGSQRFDKRYEISAHKQNSEEIK